MKSVVWNEGIKSLLKWATDVCYFYAEFSEESFSSLGLKEGRICQECLLYCLKNIHVVNDWMKKTMQEITDTYVLTVLTEISIRTSKEDNVSLNKSWNLYA